MANYLPILLVASLLDLPDLALAGNIASRLLLAAILGGVIGWEREQHQRAAGLRTHILVCTGSTLFVLTAEVLSMPADAQSRVMQGVIQGIGFLGAGTIVKLSDKAEVKGLTSAASIWSTAAIGLAAGCLAIWLPILTTAIVWLVLRPLGAIESRIATKNPQRDGVTHG